MSIDAMRWAKPIKTGRSSSKAVLTWLADMCGADLTAYPSIAALADATELNVKTVKLSLKHLIELGLIEDTGERRGATRQVIVYKLVGVNESYADSKQTQKRVSYNKPKNGLVSVSKASKNGLVSNGNQVTTDNQSKNGLVSGGKESNIGIEEAQKRATESLRATKDLKILRSPQTPKGDTTLKSDSNDFAHTASKLIDHLNRNLATLAKKLDKPTPMGFRAAKQNITLIAARLKDNFTQTDCELVLDYLTEMWGADVEMREYLCPTSIFRPSKFDDRVVKAHNWNNAGRPVREGNQWDRSRKSSFNLTDALNDTSWAENGLGL